MLNGQHHRCGAYAGANLVGYTGCLGPLNTVTCTSNSDCNCCYGGSCQNGKCICNPQFF